MKTTRIFSILALIAIFVIASVSLGPSVPFATRCAMPSFEAEFDRSAAVFVGTVVDTNKEGDKRHFVFEVKRFWKGITGKKVELSVTENMRYQAPFEEGKTYLVFAKTNEEDGSLFDDRCSRSAEIGGFSSTLEGDLENLGEAKTCISLDETGGED